MTLAAQRARREGRRRLRGPILLATAALCFVLLGVAQWLPADPHLSAHRRLAEEAKKKPHVEGGASFLEMLDGPGCSDHMSPALATVVWAVGILYMFLAIAIVCDDFFVASLEVISEVLELSDDVAGATFMAAGSSAPELFTSVTGVFFVKDVEHDNPGAGTIVGSAVFNITLIIGASVVCAGSTLELDWWPLARDGIAYAFSIILLLVAFAGVTPEQIDWWEGLFFTVCYIGYCVLMKFNQRIAERVHPSASEAVEDEMTLAPHSNLEDPDESRRRRGSSLLTLQYENRPHVYKSSQEAETPRAAPVPTPGMQEVPLEEGAVEAPEAPTAADDDDDGPSGPLGKFVFIVSWPLVQLFRFTIPDCSQEKLRKWYPVSFCTSVLWIAAISYVMVEFALKMGRCLGLSANVMGLTVLAAGTSVPDAMSSILVARQGKGNMAVSNAIGSNVFDILLGLGFPWLLSGCVRGLEPLPISTHGLVIYASMLFGVLILFMLLVGLSHWNLKVVHGYILFVIYGLFCVSSLAIDAGKFPGIPKPKQ
eukprot:TRINITY_DN10499_c0_g1_i2.p1 TRINITY_DN10499_c0_g1~~TRINITY_DN10499_c0_g1_i2.p1  ORF type:complete len:538 (-),score=115.52 TRINITY_DN10499_c0_g1_i2:21-1634(-)